MRVTLRDKRIIKLKHLQFCWASYALLMNIQQHAPNMLLEIEPESLPMRERDMHQFTPAHSLDLENFHALSLLNA